MLSRAESSDAVAEIAGNSRVTVRLPCYNKAPVIGKVVAGGLILDTVTRGRRRFGIATPVRLAHAAELLRS